MSDLDPRSELAALSVQVRGLAELDRLLGVSSSPVPLLAPLPKLAAAPAQAPRTREPAAPTPAAPAQSAPARALPTGESLQARAAANEAKLHALARRMAGCTQCRLHEGRTKLVFGQGHAAAEVVFVGEGPGYHEDQQGLAFVGKAGDLLSKMISAMGLSRDDVFICNVVKCRPPGNRNPQPDEAGTCLPYLREQLEIIQPKVICALGKSAAVGLGLISPDQGLGRSRGFHEWNGIPVMVTYHPAYLLRSPSEKGKAWHDLQQLFPHIERRRR